MRFRNRKRPCKGRKSALSDNDNKSCYCICPECNTRLPHQRGVPCYMTKCPECGASMLRQFCVTENDNESR